MLLPTTHGSLPRTHQAVTVPKKKPSVASRSHLEWRTVTQTMNFTKLVIPLQSLYWSIHTKDESKRSSAIDSSVVVSQNRLESLFHQIKCDRMTSFMEFMLRLGQIRGVFTPKWCAKLLMDVGFLEYYYIQLITFCSQVKVSEIFID